MNIKPIALMLALFALLVLTSCKSASEEEVQMPSATAAAAPDWDIRILDDRGDPVSGARLQFCTDALCVMAVSDNEGRVDFNGEKDAYEVHVLSLPAGYVYDEANAITVHKLDGSILITVTKADSK